jgi:hypothetical protein
VPATWEKHWKAIINTRAKKEANISDTQPGGIEHRSTVDHLLIPKETIKNTKETEETNIHCIPRCDTGI